jgi:hypothetical protein
METYVRAAIAVCVCLVMLVSPGFGGGQTGDQPSSGTKGALLGAGLGALASQAIGGDMLQCRTGLLISLCGGLDNYSRQSLS